MITASSSTKPAAAKSAAPIPPALALTLTSDFASAISCRISVETSRLALATSWPMDGSCLGLDHGGSGGPGRCGVGHVCSLRSTLT